MLDYYVNKYISLSRNKSAFEESEKNIREEINKYLEKLLNKFNKLRPID